MSAFSPTICLPQRIKWSRRWRVAWLVSLLLVAMGHLKRGPDGHLQRRSAVGAKHLTKSCAAVDPCDPADCPCPKSPCVADCCVEKCDPAEFEIVCNIPLCTDCVCYAGDGSPVGETEDCTVYLKASIATFTQTFCVTPHADVCKWRKVTVCDGTVFNTNYHNFGNPGDEDCPPGNLSDGGCGAAQEVVYVAELEYFHGIGGYVRIFAGYSCGPLGCNWIHVNLFYATIPSTWNCKDELILANEITTCGFWDWDNDGFINEASIANFGTVTINRCCA